MRAIRMIIALVIVVISARNAYENATARLGFISGGSYGVECTTFNIEPCKNMDSLFAMVGHQSGQRLQDEAMQKQIKTYLWALAALCCSGYIVFALIGAMRDGGSNSTSAGGSFSDASEQSDVVMLQAEDKGRS